MSIFKNIGFKWIRDLKRNFKPHEEMYIELEVRNADGSLASFRRQKAHSYLFPYLMIVQNLMGCQYGATPSACSQLVPEIGGANKTLNFKSSMYANAVLSTNCAVSSSAYGVVVGTSNAANGLNTSSLTALIAHGSTPNTLQYGAQTYEAPSNPSGLIWQWRHIRTFSNGSGGTITVNEIGTYAYLVDGAGSPWYFCLCRDVIAGGVAVNNGQTLTVRYIRSITVS